MDPGKDREHLLALKVMRLTKPSLMSNQLVLSCSQQDLPQDAFSNITKMDASLQPEMPHFSLSSLLTLPQNFGNIFLGETFSCYVSIHNDSRQLCRQIHVKADLQTSSQRLNLSGGSAQSTVAELVPDDSIDDVIHHEVKELGTHILACAVSYVTASGEKMYFRKFFKFHVLKPLDVKTKFYNTESDDVYLEAQIQNITPSPIYLDRVNLEPSSKYSVTPLNTDLVTTNATHGDLSVFGPIDSMGPSEVRQYLYCLTPRPDVSADVRQMKNVTLIGKLDIVWRSNMAERGRLQTSPLQRMVPGYGDVKVSIESVPQSVVIGSTFAVNLKVINCSERTMDLLVTLQNNVSSGLLWSSVSGRQLGKLEPCADLTLQLSMVAIRTGLLTVSGLRLVDTFLKRTYEHDELAQVIVFDNDDTSFTHLSQQQQPCQSGLTVSPVNS